MVFLVNKVRRTLGGQYSFLIVTDRIDLDAQIAGTFAHCAVIADARAARIPDSASVQDRLTLDLRVQFALVQKFKKPPPKEGFSDKPDLIVLSDEAHRTQYGTLAWNMRRALPKAKFLGFTGTPLIDTQVETAILDHLYAELPEMAFDENEVRLLSARVLGLLMRPGGEQRLH